MDTRRNIIIMGEGKAIALYTYWNGREAMGDIAIALDRGRDRWNDFGYFARIMFDVMTRNEPQGSTDGFGIYPVNDDGYSLMEPDPEYDPVIYLDNRFVYVGTEVFPFETLIDAYFDKVRAVPI